jgi:hypothetical protein
MSQAVFKINYSRHDGQREVLKEILAHPEAVIIPIVCARGWGKTLFGTCDLVLPTLLSAPHKQAMWVAPTYKIAKSPIDDVWNGVDEKTGERFIPKFDPVTNFQFWDYKVQDMEVHLFNQSKLFIRTASNPDSIVSKGYNIIIIDEGAIIDKQVFMMQILPTARRLGVKIIILTTPRGKNWVYEMYLAGQDLSKPDYLSFKQPWWKRPDYPDVLRKLMKDVPEHIRLQEFDAEFTGDGGQVFKNLGKVFAGAEIQYDSSEQEWIAPSTEYNLDAETFVVAVDLAKSVDYTVISVMAVEKRRLVYYRRLNKTDYQIVLEIIRRLTEKFNADLIFDASGVGAGLADFMTKMHANVHPFKFTNESKNEIINKLSLACEYDTIKLPNITTVREEFELFTFEISKTGKIIYNAPDGRHDDAVISIALANWFCEQNEGASQIQEIDNFLEVAESIRRPRSLLDELLAEDD